jgi:cyclic pyranopterin phosphate synthase
MGPKCGSTPTAVRRLTPLMAELPRDTFGRPLGSLRLSLTDRCNLRCRYCMPEDEYVWLPRTSILTFEEIERLAGVFAELGVSKVRLTGGEPLLRHDLPTLVAMIARNPRIRDLAMTTNGLLLGKQAVALRAAGLGRVTVSLDTLRPERMLAFAKSARHADVLEGIAAARRAGFTKLKLNSVVIRGFNDDELADLIEFGRGHDAEVRFIEYMDVGGATRWSQDQVVSQREMLEVLSRRYGAIEPVHPSGDDGRAPPPAERFRLPDGTTFGIIASVTAPFCRTCDRSRITADGTWFLCLYAARGIDLRDLLRRGATDAELAALVRETWQGRSDRGAEERLGVADRGALYRIDSLRADPHREMHTRGG